MRGLAKNILTQLRKIPLAVLVVAFIISALVSVSALRHNNQTMISLRNNVYAADKNNTDINAPLKLLRSFVYSHMNTNLSSGGNAIKPPIQLKYTYERLLTAQQQNIDGLNSQIYTDAQNYCQTQNPTSFYGRARVPCVQDYVTNHAVKTNSNSIPAALYQFDFVSPAWSPDLAGWSLVLSAILLLALVVSLVMERMVRAQVRRQQI